MTVSAPDLMALLPHGEEGFVTSLYRQFLGREPDAEGFAVYVSELRRGCAITDLIQVFLSSDEFSVRQQGSARQALAAELIARGDDASDTLATAFPADYAPPGEAGRSYQRRRTGFLDRYCAGKVVLDAGYSGYDNPENKTALPDAIGIDLDYPG